ncbi:cell division protein FtsQ/DivIB [Cupriavidus plantarum]|uniref:Cell division protein FtsQ n=1 Tax=Cupriavidus plantarum TaxID=942865 RepID=A0A316FEW1_9BURK|nr:cell division protein FtsQ/DivIB [Cupriavidus plantarum]NYH98954.1 cell division protein FtsQ [Cupriavidus plantarum]PWK36180.1 cell division protein FtsQ [Cupriavidus plantarum]REF03075.1 cell division protein FtsQ [Cupriavidus plantarum]RLK44059.1 cell division protein FtsQ [Cupriavidus plantarum]CAG2141280.1 Cell division protein FtsQ [Cupriavidus plantarum]
MWHNARLLNIIASALYALVALMALAAGLLWLAQRPVFAITHVDLSSMDGAALRHVNGPSVRANALGKLSGNFFTLDLNAARQVFESVPWVRRASVRREWPNGLAVEVEEHEALGTWGGADSGRLINTYGEVFVANTAEAEEDAQLLALDGPPDSEGDVVEKLEVMREWFKPLKAEPLAVALSSRYAWRARLSNGMVVELGREQTDEDRAAMEARVKRFVTAWPQVTEQWGRQIEYADLRYPNGFAIRAASVRFLTDAQAAAAAKAAAAGNSPNNNPTRLKSKNAEKTR